MQGINQDWSLEFFQNFDTDKSYLKTTSTIFDDDFGFRCTIKSWTIYLDRIKIENLPNILLSTSKSYLECILVQIKGWKRRWKHIK